MGRFDKIETVFVDMDGVLADFVGGVLRLHDIPDTQYNPQGSYDIHTYLKMSASQFWGAIDNDSRFWETLSLTPEATLLIDLLESLTSYKNIYLLSSPALHPNCFYGKAVWIKKHFPEYLPKLILTAHKHFLAAPNRLLIDDSDSNVTKFRQAEGLAILFPRKWNERYAVHAAAFDSVKQQLEQSLW
jgi:5'(3')-deoxyribonucleotidase